MPMPLPLTSARGDSAAAMPRCGRAAPPTRLQACAPDDPARAEVEAYIRGVYRERYDAEVRYFAPCLVALRDGAGEIVAAAGYRAAADGPLFLERYLHAPVQTLLAAPPPVRSQVVEVGHLAATRAGEGRRLILLLGPHLAAQGHRWVVSTLTQELRQLLVRLGIAPLTLGVADPAALGEEAAQWGRYYDHRPVVLAGPLQHALALFAERGLLER